MNVNHKNETIMKIRSILIQNPNKLKIMWIPSHVGIIGNEKADEAATSATKQDSYANAPTIRRHA